MTKVLIEKEILSSIADAIREKTGTDSLFKPSEMTGAIQSIPYDPYPGDNYIYLDNFSVLGEEFPEGMYAEVCRINVTTQHIFFDMQSPVSCNFEYTLQLYDSNDNMLYESSDYNFRYNPDFSSSLIHYLGDTVDPYQVYRAVLTIHNVCRIYYYTPNVVFNGPEILSLDYYDCYYDIHDDNYELHFGYYSLSDNNYAVKLNVSSGSIDQQLRIQYLAANESLGSGLWLSMDQSDINNITFTFECIEVPNNEIPCIVENIVPNLVITDPLVYCSGYRYSYTDEYTAGNYLQFQVICYFYSEDNTLLYEGEPTWSEAYDHQQSWYASNAFEPEIIDQISSAKLRFIPIDYVDPEEPSTEEEF